MTLVEAWGDSLSLLKPKSLKLFLLVTLKSIGDAYKLLLKYWWWLLAIVVGCFVIPSVWDVSLMNYIYIQKISYWVYQILLFATLVATRPSLEKKNCMYFRMYMLYFLPVVLLLLILPYHLWPMPISPIYFFTILFFLDSSKKIKDFPLSFLRALKMVIYNFPLLVLVGMFFYMPIHILISYVDIDPFSITANPVLVCIGGIITFALIPITVCFYANIYIKKLHDQFDLYFKQPS